LGSLNISTRRTADVIESSGATLGSLLDPDTKEIHVYRPGAPVEVLKNPIKMNGEPVLAKFVFDVRRVWTAMEPND
jgi:hypothetical protein